MKTISIHQPAYLPWCGGLARIALSDVHVVLDHVQLEKGSFINRNKIRVGDGWRWLTIPVKTSGSALDLDIADAQCAGDRWRARHLKSLQASYGRAPHFRAAADAIAAFYADESPRLLDACMGSMALLLRAFSIATPLVSSSTLALTEKKSALVLEICRRLGATHYLSGPLGRGYLDIASFEAAGIAVQFHDYAHPRYTQAQGGFIAGMTALDLWLNHGDAARAILVDGAAPTLTTAASG